MLSRAVLACLTRGLALFSTYLLLTVLACLLELCLHAWCWCRALFYFFSRSALLLALALRLLVCLVLVLARAVLYLILVADALSRRACVFDAGARAVVYLLTTNSPCLLARAVLACLVLVPRSVLLFSRSALLLALALRLFVCYWCSLALCSTT